MARRKKGAFGSGRGTGAWSGSAATRNRPKRGGMVKFKRRKKAAFGKGGVFNR